MKGRSKKGHAVQTSNTAIVDAIHDFLEAFSILDHAGMMAFFSQDATSFFPLEHSVRRMNNKKEISKGFSRVIEKIKEMGQSRIHLEPEGLQIQELNDGAVVTFHLKNDVFCRRTLVLTKTEGKWMIAHLHASNAPAKGAEP
jgi:ketosteroid isomerase-like protein